MSVVAEFKALFDVRGFVGTVADMAEAVRAYHEADAEADAAADRRAEAAWEARYQGLDAPDEGLWA